ncbi:Gfo/Idh/MocA family protein [Cohnella fermenti]|uniref:Gfo/Idh/MocA family oxidoreductase n=1 Tax=Cohnella fermenti TaxID=2565925 RepID=A0A4S4BKG6_9BACL|nr:Gfo/Idh/MocA family oxidoreductase [Cohnella fermenti]THF75219.1 Gfo/Idh/MocA family oxidoreductase [Cohnella fermenti]
MRHVKAAILGAGFIGRAHVEALRRLGYVDVVAIGQSNQAKAERYANELGVPKAYGNYMELLQDNEIEVIHNCTPNHLHYEINRQALLHGKHLLSEKPLTLTSAEAKELYELAASASLITGLNYNYRQFPMVQHLKGMVKDEDLGRVNLIRGSYLQDWLLHETDYNWRMEPRYGGTTRAISDIGSHLFDLVQYITGLRFSEVLADSSIVWPTRYRSSVAKESFQRRAEGELEPVDIVTEDYCSVLVKFAGGARGVFTVSQVSPGNKNALEVHIDGGKASGSWKQEEPFLLHLGYRDRASERLVRDPGLLKKDALPFLHYPGGHEEGWTDSLKNMMHNFYRAIGSGAPLSDSVATFKDGYQTMLINDAIVRSIQSGSWEKIDNV